METTACFCLQSDTLDPSEVTELLAIDASHEHYKDEARQGPRFRKPWPNAVWLLESTLPRSASIEAHLGWLLVALEGKRMQLRGLLDRGWQADFVVGMCSESDQVGAYIPASMIRRMGELGVSLALDGYGGSQ